MDTGPVFPQELFDTVIDHLADDSLTLRACALVSTGFHARARTFYRLRFGRLDENRTPTKLYELLESSPSFAASVRSLLIRERFFGANGVRWTMMLASPSPADQCLALLASLTRLCIGLAADIMPFGWDRIPKALRDSIQHTVARPTFTCLELHNISELPFTLLCHCPALRSLTLKRVSFSGEWPAAVAACVGSLPARLEHLSLELNPVLFDLFTRWILLPESPLDISCLRVLECPAYHHGPGCTIQPILSTSASTLQSLRFNNCEIIEITWPGVLHLHDFPHLHTLCIDIRRDAFASGDMRVFSLRHINFSGRQQPLALNFHLHTQYAYSAAAWFSGADRTLAALPFITNVTVIVSPLSPWVRPRDSRECPTEDLIDVSSEFVQKMPLLVKRIAGRSGALRLLRSSRFNKATMFPLAALPPPWFSKGLEGDMKLSLFTVA
ncbi:hypothetical protein C8R45DRAFT_1217996 [Mycena sanguinolenta]|nr:hypothetical protein C8R45DRAFT_1217996 [Mycena sanguinolenta]